MTTTAPCAVCSANGYPEFCTSDHTPSVVRLAEVLDRSLQGPAQTKPHPEWYIDDAAAIANHVTEGNGWVIEHDEGGLGEFFKVNGVEFYIDVNADGYDEPELAVAERARRAEEAEWDRDPDGQP